MAEGLELAAAKRLLDDAKAGGFAFQRTGPEPDAPLLGVRETAREAGGDVLLAAPHGPVLRLLTVLGLPGVYPSVAAAADSAGRRDARRRAVSVVRSGRAVLSGALYWMTAWRAAVPGSRAGNRSWSPR